MHTVWHLLSALSRGAVLRRRVAAEGLGQASAVRPRPPPGGASAPGGSHGGHHRPWAGQQVGTLQVYTYTHTHTHSENSVKTCSYAATALCCYAANSVLSHFSTETNHRAKLALKATSRAPKQRDSEGGSSACLPSSAASFCFLVFPEQAAQCEWTAAIWKTAASLHLVFTLLPNGETTGFEC